MGLLATLVPGLRESRSILLAGTLGFTILLIWLPGGYISEGAQLLGFISDRLPDTIAGPLPVALILAAVFLIGILYTTGTNKLLGKLESAIKPITRKLLEEGCISRLTNRGIPPFVACRFPINWAISQFLQQRKAQLSNGTGPQRDAYEREHTEAETRLILAVGFPSVCISLAASGNVPIIPISSRILMVIAGIAVLVVLLIDMWWRAAKANEELGGIVYSDHAFDLTPLTSIISMLELYQLDRKDAGAWQAAFIECLQQRDYTDAIEEALNRANTLDVPSTESFEKLLELRAPHYVDDWQKVKKTRGATSN